VWQDCDQWGKNVHMMLGTYPITDDSWVALLKERISAAFKLRPAADWERIFTCVKVPAAAVLTTSEWIHGQHALESGLIAERMLSKQEIESLASASSSSSFSLPPAQAGEDVYVLEAGPLVWNKACKLAMSVEARRQSKEDLFKRMQNAQLEPTADSITRTLQTMPTPSSDAAEHAFPSSSPHEEGSWTSSRARRLRGASCKLHSPYGAANAAPPLSGVRVLDFCNVIAGPMIGCLLRRCGATVIKVDPSTPSYDALVAVYMGLCTNRGKLSCLCDIKNPSAKEILRRLLQWADVVLCNQVPSQMKALGLSEEDLHAINPRINLMRFDAYGGPLSLGPHVNKLGYDDILQVLALVFPIQICIGNLQAPKHPVRV